VKQVVPDSPAAKAGLQAEDRIHSVGGIEVQDPTHLQSVIGRFFAGDKVEVVVQRGEEKKTLEAELIVPPPPPKPMPMPMPMPMKPMPGQEPKPSEPKPEEPKPMPPAPADEKPAM
jgi:membrane-associated protease RseP (regulator of RpoE activity)